MLLETCIVFAHLGASISPRAGYQLCYQAEKVQFQPDRPAPIVCYTERVEHDLTQNWWKWTRIEEGTSTISETRGDRIYLETIHPDGSHESREIPAKALLGTINQAIADEDGSFKIENLMDSTSKAKPQKLDEFKTIAGVRCQKSITKLTIGGRHVEYITFEPVMMKEGLMPPFFESDTYTVEGDVRRLQQAETVTSFRSGA